MSNRILSYKGSIADGATETILLSTKKGEVGYRINKFEIMTQTFVNAELFVQIWKDSGVTFTQIDFSDNRLLAAAQFSQSSASETNPDDTMIIFDREIFNQDIYITNTGVSNARTMNYYLELEVMKLDESQAMVATLKDIRNNS